MDFTPMSLDEIPNIDRRTSKAFELALTVVYESGVQHLAESPAGTAKQPQEIIQYLQDLPKTWSDTKFVAGFPGEFAVLARKGDGRWYVGGINGADENKSIPLDLSFAKGDNKWLLIKDSGDKASFDVVEVAGNGVGNIDLLPNTGFVLFQLK